MIKKKVVACMQIFKRKKKRSGHLVGKKGRQRAVNDTRSLGKNQKVMEISETGRGLLYPEKSCRSLDHHEPSCFIVRE